MSKVLPADYIRTANFALASRHLPQMQPMEISFGEAGFTILYGALQITDDGRYMLTHFPKRWFSSTFLR